MLISQTVKDALITLGVINPIDEANPQDSSFALRTLNRIVDAYNSQNLLITYLQTIALPKPTIWTNNFTIGVDKDINTEAPIDIESAFFRQNETDYPISLMSLNNWNSISFKSVKGIPTLYSIRKMNDNSIEMYLNIIPQDDMILYITGKMPYTGVNADGNNYLLTDDIKWSFGVEKMLMYRLAIELAPSYNIPVTQVLYNLAQEAENNIKMNNYIPRTIKTNSGYQQKRYTINRAKF